jgi:signal transduction histidine kinase
LTSIRGHAEQLLEAPRLASGDGAPAGTDAPSKPGPQARIETILQNADRLDHLSDRLHALSRMDVSGSELDVARFSLAELIHDMVVKFQPTAEEQNLTLQADLPADPPRARGDIGQVERLLSNLVENAMEHTPAGGDVAVRLRPKGAEMQVAVTDTGVGIPEEDIPLVTQRFYQVERASLNREKPEAGRSGEDISRPRSEGTGLGLAIAAQVARAHGGQLEIESTLGDGTTVSFTLPAAEE